LLSVEYEKNPLESEFDSRVSGKLAPLLIVFDVLLAERVRTWWVGAVGGAGTQLGTLMQAREFAAQSVHAAHAKAHDLFVTAVASASHSMIKVDLHLSAPTLLVPFEVQSSPAHTNSRRVTAVAAVSMGTLRMCNKEAVADADVYEVLLEGVRIGLCETQAENWREHASWRTDTGLVAPFTVALTVTNSIRPDDTAIPLVHIQGLISAVNLNVSERDCQRLQQLSDVLSGRNLGHTRKTLGHSANTTGPISPDPSPFRLLKSLSLPFDFSDSYRLDDSSAPPPPSLRRGVSYSESRTKGMRQASFLHMLYPKRRGTSGKVLERGEMNTEAVNRIGGREDDVENEKVEKERGEEDARWRGVVCEFAMECMVLQIKRHDDDGGSPLVRVVARELKVDFAMHSQSANASVRLGQIVLDNLHTAFRGAQYQTFASGIPRTDEAVQNSGTKVQSTFEIAPHARGHAEPVDFCRLDVSYFDRKSPDWRADTVVTANAGGFRLVCYEPIVNSLMCWFVDAFAAQAGRQLPERGSHNCVGDVTVNAPSLEVGVVIGKLEVEFVAVADVGQSCECAPLGMLSAVGFAVSHVQSVEVGVSTSIQLSEFRVFDLRASFPKSGGAGCTEAREGKQTEIFGPAPVDPPTPSATAPPLLNIQYHEQACRSEVANLASRLTVDIEKSRVFLVPDFFAECLDFSVQLAHLASQISNVPTSSATRTHEASHQLPVARSARVFRDSIGAFEDAMAGTRTRDTHPARASPVVCVKVSSLVVSAAPPAHPNTMCTFEMSALELYSCSELSADIRVGAFQLSSIREQTQVWHADFGGVFKKNTDALNSCGDGVCRANYSADFTTLNFTLDPLMVAHLAEIWREFARHDLSARIAKLALQRSAEQTAKTVLLMEGCVGEKDAQIRIAQEQLHVTVTIHNLCVGFVRDLLPTATATAETASSSNLQHDRFSVSCQSVEGSLSHSPEGLVECNFAIQDFAIEFDEPSTHINAERVLAAHKMKPLRHGEAPEGGRSPDSPKCGNSEIKSSTGKCNRV